MTSILTTAPGQAMNSTCGGHEIEEQEENTHLQNVYSLGELQDYICHTTVPAANGDHNNSMVSHGHCCANSYLSFSASSWSANSMCSSSIQRTGHSTLRHTTFISALTVVTSPITMMQLPHSSSSLEAAAIMEHSTSG